MGLTASSNERAPEPACVPPIAPAVGRSCGIAATPRSPPRPAFLMASEGRRTEQQRRLVSFWQRGRCARPKAGAPRAGRKERRPGLVPFGCFWAGDQRGEIEEVLNPTAGAQNEPPPRRAPQPSRRRQAPSPPPKRAFLKVGKMIPLAKPSMTAATATDRPHHPGGGIASTRARVSVVARLSSLSTSPRTRRRDDGGGGGAHHSPRNHASTKVW